MSRPLLVVPFGGSNDPLERLEGSDQAQYILCYLADLKAISAVVEPTYFDRDYLSEFASFYCTSTAGYANVCKRVHAGSSTSMPKWNLTHDSARLLGNALFSHASTVENATRLPCSVRPCALAVSPRSCAPIWRSWYEGK